MSGNHWWHNEPTAEDLIVHAAQRKFRERQRMTDKPSYRIHQENDDWIITEISLDHNRALREFRITGPTKDKIRLTFEHATGHNPSIPKPDLAAACLALAPDHLTITEIVDYLVAQIPKPPKFTPQEIQARIDALEGKLATVRSEYTDVLRQANMTSVAVTNLSNQINIIMNGVSTLRKGLK